MKHLRKAAAIAFVALAFTACRKEAMPPQQNQEGSDETTAEEARHDHGSNGGYVYTLSNQADNNKVIVYRRKSNGELTFLANYPTGGKGTGGGLGSQGAVIMTEDDGMLLAVNAGSNTISSFEISGNHLHLVSVVHSGGTMPVSITQHDDLVYVLNAGGNGNISGFRINKKGKLFPIHHSTRPLSSNMSGPAQISFVNHGRVLVITEKATNKIISYTINYYGTSGAFHSITSASPTPFGFAVRGYGNIIVSEAAGGAAGVSALSSYKVHNNGSISLAEGPVSAGQTAACWVVVTDNKKYIYTTNTGSNNISSFKAGFDLGLDVLNPIAATSGTGPIDADLSKDSRYLYVLNSGSNSISAYSIGYDGGLDDVQTVTGLPAGASGLAAK
jgi:6-phosphogluconolactonase